MSRLTSASGAYGSYAYEYDLVGNRTRRTVNALIEDYAYFNGTHRLGSVTASGLSRSFTYAPSGQMLSSNDPGNPQAATSNFALDPEGRVRRVTLDGVDEVVYTYDAFNLRVAKFVAAGNPTIEGGNSVHFIYDLDGRLIAEHDGGTGVVLREYVYFGLMPVAFVSYDAAGTASVYAVHTDQVNMPQKLTDASGAVVHDRVYTPFGETISVTGTLTQTLRFPGQRNDSETGLFQNWHRDYDPTLGRYVQSDPIGLSGGINTYAYVDGNPLGFVDPQGLFESPLGGLIGPWNKPLPKNDSLVFNGSSLNAIDGTGAIINSWPAVSGRDDSCQCRDDQDKPDFGPIPEGDYSVSRFQSNRRRFWKRDWGPESAWGNVRTPIQPKPRTRTFGRRGMYMHGGKVPGSIGCIDLTESNEDFHQWLGDRWYPVDLTVQY